MLTGLDGLYCLYCLCSFSFSFSRGHGGYNVCFFFFFFVIAQNLGVDKYQGKEKCFICFVHRYLQPLSSLKVQSLRAF